MRFFLVGPLVVLTTLGCWHARAVPEPAFTPGVWRIRLQADSTPTRRVPHNPVEGTIDFAAGVSHVDFRRLIGHELSTRAEVKAEQDSAQATPVTRYRIVLGEPNSDVDKIVLVGHAARPDSLAGIWSETILCCSATGTFALWRARR